VQGGIFLKNATRPCGFEGIEALQTGSGGNGVFQMPLMQDWRWFNMSERLQSLKKKRALVIYERVTT